jgi:sarcosine oxidase, subunit gamma
MLENHAAARRHGVFEQSLPLPFSGAIAVKTLGPEARFVLRLGADDAASIGRVAGLSLALPVNRTSQSEQRMAARLGPDEWLLVATDAEAEAFLAEAAGALAGCHHALTDVSHRNVGIEVSGPAAAIVLNAGCPLDLGDDHFPVGSATRTLFGKAEVVILRIEDGTGHPRYRIECWRSFGRYVHAFLSEAARECAAG